MRALALQYPDRTLSEVARPEPLLAGPDEVLLRVLEIGVCGTDRGLIEGRLGRPPSGEEQLVLGHEALCEVLAAGSSVTAVQPGDLVAPMIRRACDPETPLPSEPRCGNDGSAHPAGGRRSRGGRGGEGRAYRE